VADAVIKLAGSTSMTAIVGSYISLAMIPAISETTVPPGKDEPFKPGKP
jgi:4-carboxymuconolactone decarboxylase